MSIFDFIARSSSKRNFKMEILKRSSVFTLKYPSFRSLRLSTLKYPQIIHLCRVNRDKKESLRGRGFYISKQTNGCVEKETSRWRTAGEVIFDHVFCIFPLFNPLISNSNIKGTKKEATSRSYICSTFSCSRRRYSYSLNMISSFYSSIWNSNLLFPAPEIFCCWWVRGNVESF